MEETTLQANAQEATVIDCGSAAPQVHVPDFLIGSILVTLFCCMPVGIASVVFAARANGKKAAGDYEGALQDVKKAKLWMFISAGLYLAAAFLYCLIYLAIFVITLMSEGID